MGEHIPSGPRLFDADGGGFLDDFFLLPMFKRIMGMPKEAGYKNMVGGCFDYHRVKWRRRWWNIETCAGSCESECTWTV